jgi:hypothetical protein
MANNTNNTSTTPGSSAMNFCVFHISVYTAVALFLAKLL